MVLGTLLPDGAYFISLKNKPGRSILQCTDLQLPGYSNVWYLSNHKYWAFSNSIGELKVCSIKNRSRNVLESSVIYYKRHHTELITMLKEIDDPEMLCSCSLDGTVKLLSLNSLRICLLDDASERKNSVLDSRNKKAYLGFDYSNQFGRYILLYGFSNTISIHSLDISLTKGYAGRYSEHTVSIRHARFVRGNPYIISVDEKCCIRVWNFRTFKTHQIIDGDRMFSSQCQILVVPELDSFYIAERKICQFKSISFFKRSKQINQFHRPIDFFYNTYLNSFWLFTSNDARQYDNLTGRLKQVITNLSDQKCEFVVTAAQFGPKYRKIYIGDAAGFVREYSTETGEFIQELKPIEDIKEYKQIRKIIYVNQEDLVICASVDGRILAFVRNDSNEYTLIRDIRGSHTSDLTGMCYSAAYHLMATSCEGGTINIWNSTKYVLETVLVTGASSRLVDIRFVKNYPVILACCENMEIMCFGVRPIEQSLKHKCIFKILHEPRPEQPLRTLTCFDVQIKKTFLNVDNINETMSSLLLEHTMHTFMCIGEKDGTITVMCLDVPFKQFGICKTDRIESEEASHPRRYDYCYVDKLVQSFITRRSIQDNKISAPIVKFQDVTIGCWQGHHGPVQKIKLLKQPFVLMTDGQDQKFKVWELTGKVCGIINCETFKNSLWRMPEVNIKHRLKQADFVLYILKLIDGEVVSEEKQESIKVRMLMNKYMDETQKDRFRAYLRNKREHEQVDDLNSAVSTPVTIKSEIVHQNQTFQQNYDQVMSKLKSRLASIDNQIQSSKVDRKLHSTIHPLIQLTSESALDKKKIGDCKQIRTLKTRLEAIEQHIPDTTQQRPELAKARPDKKSKSAKHKDCLFVSYSQLKRNLTAMHKMLRINNIR